MDVADVGVILAGEPYAGDVKAAASGVVHRSFGLDLATEANQLRRWDPATETYSWTPAPSGGGNHGLGQTVIIFHEQLGLYSLYGHLDAVASGLELGAEVGAGEVIGRMGNSAGGYLRRCKADSSCPEPGAGEEGIPVGTTLVTRDGDGFGVHVHVEVKDRGVLSAGTHDESRYDGNVDSCDTFPSSVPERCYGYIPVGSETLGRDGYPNWYGFHDPRWFIDHDVATLATPVVVEVQEYDLLVRDYFGVDSAKSLVLSEISARADGRRAAFVATRSVGGEWYQVHVPNDPVEGWSSAALIAGELDGTAYSVPRFDLDHLMVTAERAAVTAKDDATALEVASARGELAANPQRVVPFEESARKYRVYLTAKGVQADGWVAKEDVELVEAQGGPSAPTNPAPADGASVPGPVDRLDWGDVAGALEYEVALDGEVVAVVTESEWQPAEPIGAGVHWWQVTAHGIAGETTGPFWRFAASTRSELGSLRMDLEANPNFAQSRGRIHYTASLVNKGLGVIEDLTVAHVVPETADVPHHAIRDGGDCPFNGFGTCFAGNVIS